MYRLQVWVNKHWKWGLNEYKSFEEATKRIEQLKRAGIKARMKLSSEFYN